MRDVGAAEKDDDGLVFSSGRISDAGEDRLAAGGEVDVFRLDRERRRAGDHEAEEAAAEAHSRLRDA